MKIKKTIGVLLFAAGLTTFTVSCTDNNKDSKEVAEEMNENKFDKDGERIADKLVHAYSANLFEVKTAEYAVQKANSPEVKKLAVMLVSAHSQMNEEVKKLAEQKQVSLPDALTDEQSKTIADLNEKSGSDYDKEFTELMKKKHEDSVDFYEKTADKSDDAEIKSWATRMVTEVRSHLDMVLNAHHLVHDNK